MTKLRLVGEAMIGRRVRFISQGGDDRVQPRVGKVADYVITVPDHTGRRILFLKVNFRGTPQLIMIEKVITV